MKDALRRLGFCTRYTRPSFVSFGTCVKVGTMFAKCVTTRFLNLVCQAQKDTDISEKPCSFCHLTFFFNFKTARRLLASKENVRQVTPGAPRHEPAVIFA